MRRRVGGEKGIPSPTNRDPPPYLFPVNAQKGELRFKSSLPFSFLLFSSYGIFFPVKLCMQQYVYKYVCIDGERNGTKWRIFSGEEQHDEMVQKNVVALLFVGYFQDFQSDLHLLSLSLSYICFSFSLLWVLTWRKSNPCNIWKRHRLIRVEFFNHYACS